MSEEQISHPKEQSVQEDHAQNQNQNPDAKLQQPKLRTKVLFCCSFLGGWEISWLQEIWAGESHEWVMVDYSTLQKDQIPNHAWWVMSTPQELLRIVRMGEAVHGAADSANFKFGLIHLGDDWIQGDRHSGLYKKAFHVYRNYFDPRLVSPSISFFSLGYKAHFWDKKESNRFWATPFKADPLLITSTERKYKWSFVGHVKQDRKEMLDVLQPIRPNHVFTTTAFAGSDCLTTSQYRDIMLDSVFIPNGCGFASLDCFRVYEALECGCIPIVKRTQKGYPYFDHLLGKGHPLWQVETWKEALDRIRDTSEQAIEEARVAAHRWWQEHKKQLQERVVEVSSKL